MPDTRDELARMLHDHEPVDPQDLFVSACKCGWANEVYAHSAHLAEAILASGVLANLRAEARKQLARELQERMTVAEGSLRERRNSLDDDVDRYAILRVSSKEEGVRLARTYVEEELR